jgi:hypothetical protein
MVFQSLHAGIALHYIASHRIALLLQGDTKKYYLASQGRLFFAVTREYTDWDASVRFSVQNHAAPRRKNTSFRARFLWRFSLLWRRVSGFLKLTIVGVADFSSGAHWQGGFGCYLKWTGAVDIQ